ncbi:CLAVATA3/ESR (CLE)-related protein 12 [Linum perenne]
MALKVPTLLFLILLWLSFIFIIFHELYGFKTYHHNKKHIIISSSSSSIASRRQHDHHHHPEATNYRKVLASKFDFTRFRKPATPPPHRRHNRHRDHKTNHQHNHKGSPADDHDDQQGGSNEIDPRYGVDKRLVPTGPNPLHH